MDAGERASNRDVCRSLGGIFVETSHGIRCWSAGMRDWAGPCEERWLDWVDRVLGRVSWIDARITGLWVASKRERCRG